MLSHCHKFLAQKYNDQRCHVHCVIYSQQQCAASAMVTKLTSVKGADSGEGAEKNTNNNDASKSEGQTQTEPELPATLIIGAQVPEQPATPSTQAQVRGVATPSHGTQLLPSTAGTTIPRRCQISRHLLR